MKFYFKRQNKFQCIKKLPLLSCLVTGEALRHAQSKQNCELSLLNLQACCWERLLVPKAAFSLFCTASGFVLSPVSEHDRSTSEPVRDVFTYLVYDCFHGLQSLGEKHRRETNKFLKYLHMQHAKEW